jgi:hypothetical protein
VVSSWVRSLVGDAHLRVSALSSSHPAVAPLDGSPSHSGSGDDGQAPANGDGDPEFLGSSEVARCRQVTAASHWIQSSSDLDPVW